MKTYTLLLAAMVVLLLGCSNQKKTTKAACYKARLEKKGICGNYTLKLLDGEMDASKIEATWRNETTGVTYTNVFGLLSVCTFPSRLNEGDEFWFTLADSTEQCNVCMAYYPSPAKKLSIAVLDVPCK